MAKIKKDTSLRKAILQAAITGQLISNVDGETETGKQLLDRIIEERKNKLSHGLDFANAKSGKRKSKKETALASSNPCDIPEDEISFEIPESWCWCRLSEYLDIRDGTHDSPKFYDTGIPFVTSKNLNNGKLDFSECKYITEEDHKKFSARSFVEDGDILFAMIGSIGNPVMVKKEFDFSFKNMALFKCYSKENTNMKYIYFYLCHIQKELKEIATGGVQSFIGLGTFREMIFPLPPLAVQNAIVAKLEEVLPLVDAYENAVLQKEELKNALLDKVKKAILQEAIQGKLTEDWRIEMLKQVQHDGHTEETGKKLLDRIIQERKKMSHGLDFANAKSGKRKAKKETALADSNPCDIPEDEIPFEIPESWCWCRLGDLFNIISARRVHQKDWTMEGVPFYRAREIAKLSEFGFVNNELFISESHFSQLKVNGVPLKNDLMVTAVGTLGKTYVVKEADRFYYKDASVICFENRNGINPYYIKNFMDSAFMLEQIKSNSSGTTVGTLTIERTKEYLFPLPPLAEQEKIVEIIEQMLPLCEKLGG